jgi:hypothetical protein
MVKKQRKERQAAVSQSEPFWICRPVSTSLCTTHPKRGADSFGFWPMPPELEMFPRFLSRLHLRAQVRIGCPALELARRLSATAAVQPGLHPIAATPAALLLMHMFTTLCTASACHQYKLYLLRSCYYPAPPRLGYARFSLSRLIACLPLNMCTMPQQMYGSPLWLGALHCGPAPWHSSTVLRATCNADQRSCCTVVR